MLHVSCASHACRCHREGFGTWLSGDSVETQLESAHACRWSCHPDFAVTVAVLNAMRMRGPRCLIIENVPGMLHESGSAGEGASSGFAFLSKKVEEAGYVAKPFWGDLQLFHACARRRTRSCMYCEAYGVLRLSRLILTWQKQKMLLLESVMHSCRSLKNPTPRACGRVALACVRRWLGTGGARGEREREVASLSLSSVMYCGFQISPCACRIYIVIVRAEESRLLDDVTKNLEHACEIIRG